MGLKFYFYILLVTLSVTSFACNSGKTASEKQIEVFFVDEHLTESVDGEVVFNDQTESSKNKQVSTAQESSQEMAQMLDDNSEIVVKYDGYGNKTETRSFNNHPRIATILIRTAANGQKQFYVYGYGKEVKTLTGEMGEKALTASADELANAAGLYEARSNEEITNFRKKSQPLQPLPSNNFPIQMPQNIPPQTEDVEQKTASSEENPSVVDESKYLVTTTRKPDEEKQ